MTGAKKSYVPKITLFMPVDHATKILSAWLSKKGENDSENFPGLKSQKSQNHSQASFLSDLDPKIWAWGCTGQQNKPFWLKNMIFIWKMWFSRHWPKRSWPVGAHPIFLCFPIGNTPGYNI